MNRITNKHLAGLTTRLNHITNNPNTYATQSPDGHFTINIGHYHIDRAYGGCRLVQTVTDGGGIRDVLSGGYGTKREAYCLINAYIRGIEVGNAQ